MRYFVSFLIGFVCITSHVCGQHTNILISNDPQSLNEPAIIINPNQPNQLVAGTNFSQYHYSTDGGLTWQNDFLTSSLGTMGDPCIAVDNLNNFYYFHLAPNIDRIICQKSTNGGQSWSDGTFTTPADILLVHDKEWGVADPLNNNIYVSWTQYENPFNPTSADSTDILFARSSDGGQTWSNPLRLNKVRGDVLYKDVIDPTPATGINNEVYVAWADSVGIRFDRSLDNGTTWLSDDVLVATVPTTSYYHVSGNARDSVRTSANIECDLSNSPYRGTIYVSWTDARNGEDNGDVFVSKSTDNGNTWSAPLRVNDEGHTAQQYYSSMTVDQATGYIYWAFYDRRNHPNSDSTDVYMAVSTDGAQTFNNFKISETPFLPNDFVFIGDYLGITAYNNVVRPIWIRTDNFNQNSLWTAMIDVPLVTGIALLPNTALSLQMHLSPNPCDNISVIDFHLPQNGAYMLRITDLQGRIMFEQQEANTVQGKHQCVVTTNSWTSGIYVCELLTNGTRLAERLVVR